jgi:hypothetical protein|eukprot:COSAG02_NODE_8886_length_2409_cov_1.267532_2_plen_103_part_00
MLLNTAYNGSGARPEFLFPQLGSSYGSSTGLNLFCYKLVVCLPPPSNRTRCVSLLEFDAGMWLLCAVAAQVVSLSKMTPALLRGPEGSGTVTAGTAKEGSLV